jgi:hypothetical protein
LLTLIFELSFASPLGLPVEIATKVILNLMHGVVKVVIMGGLTMLGREK